MNIVDLFPAYGRRYDTVRDMYRDWKNGKDFTLGLNGPYCSIRDADTLQMEYEVDAVNLRQLGFKKPTLDITLIL
jgi:hypothetical protein